MLSRLPNAARLGLWSVLLFAITLWLGTLHNDFPWYYHPDEPGKVEQVLGTRPLNFHHPMLLLNSAIAAFKLSGAEPNPQTVVQIGRAVSACFTAAAVALLSLLAYSWRGWRVAIFAGLALATHHQLFELAHYFKEDTALLFGLAVAFVAADRHRRNPTLQNAIALGAGVGLAISGKVPGALSLLFAVPVFIATRKHCGWRPAAAAAITAAVVFAATNPQAFANPAAVVENFNREAKLVTTGQGMTQSVPHTKYWSIFLGNTTPVIWVLILTAIGAAWRRRAELNVAERCTFIFPFALAILMSFLPKENDRYFLPATALFTVIAAAGVADIAKALQRRYRRGVVEIICGTALVAGQFISWTDDRAGLLEYMDAFRTDDTADALDWLRQNAKSTDVIAKDDRVRLPDERRKSRKARPLPNKVLSDDYVADLGSIEKLRGDGVEFVIVSESTYKRFERSSLRPKKGGEDDAERRRAFYADLRRSYEPVWSRPRSTVIYLHPGIEIYRISQSN